MRNKNDQCNGDHYIYYSLKCQYSYNFQEVEFQLREEKYLHFFSPQAAARLVTFDPESLGMPSPIVQAGVMTEL